MDRLEQDSKQKRKIESRRAAILLLFPFTLTVNLNSITVAYLDDEPFYPKSPSHKVTRDRTVLPLDECQGLYTKLNGGIPSILRRHEQVTGRCSPVRPTPWGHKIFEESEGRFVGGTAL